MKRTVEVPLRVGGGGTAFYVRVTRNNLRARAIELSRLLCLGILWSRLFLSGEIAAADGRARSAAQAEVMVNSSPRLESGEDSTLAQLIRESLASRPEIAEAQAAARAARERVPQESALPDPMLQVGVQNDGFSSWQVGKMETSWYSVMASQTFPWPGKRRLRGEIAERGAGQSVDQVARARLSTQADVRRGYLALILARDRLALLDRLEGVLGKSAALARTRYETGQGAQSDVLRAQLELNRLKQRRLALEAEVENEVRELNRLRNHSSSDPIPTSVHLADVALPESSDVEAASRDAVERSPELRAARRQLAQAQVLRTLAKRSYFPDLTVGLGLMVRGTGFPPMWLATVGAPIPVFLGRKQGCAVAESEAIVLAQRKNADALKQLVRLRVGQRRTRLDAIVKTIQLYRGGLLVQSEATAGSTLAQYEVGKVPFASVLEANIGLIGDEEAYLDALAEAHRLEIASAELSLIPVVGDASRIGVSSQLNAGTETSSYVPSGRVGSSGASTGSVGASAMAGM